MKTCSIHGETEFILVDYLLIRYECSKCLMSKTIELETPKDNIIKVDFRKKL